MITSVINFKINTKNKQVFEDICEKLGISISSALNMYVNKVINSNGIPFELRVATNELQERERLRLTLTAFNQNAPSYKEMASKQGIKTDEDIASMITQMRRDRRKKST
ncbi:MAG: type II toxin-antitoxin system RelB/DinJ family antitoxin [Mycoplasmataceae bacterium]|jgi:DNA-damage-inducible protein J|nr:type II toxin-antitoxin system RelB/DinJ family antitoxin [Mycoplasmataceae bacterium]